MDSLEGFFAAVKAIVFGELDVFEGFLLPLDGRIITVDGIRTSLGIHAVGVLQIQFQTTLGELHCLPGIPNRFVGTGRQDERFVIDGMGHFRVQTHRFVVIGNRYGVLTSARLRPPTTVVSRRKLRIESDQKSIGARHVPGTYRGPIKVATSNQPMQAFWKSLPFEATGFRSYRSDHIGIAG